MNVFTVAGKVGKDAVLRHTDKNDVAGFSLAEDIGYGDNKKTQWYDCSIWGTRAEKLASYILKGQAVTVTGTLGTREHDGKTYITINVNDIALQGGKPVAKPDTDRTKEALTGVHGSTNDPFGDRIPF